MDANTRGFTLIELLTVVALIGVIGAMALPAFTQMIENNRRVAAVNDLLSTIHVARSEAITRNQRISICPANTGQTACEAGGWQKGWLIFRDVGADGVFEAVDGDEIIRVGDGLRGNLSVVSAEFQSAVTFGPNGRVAGGDGTILLCADGVATAVRRIDIDRTGRPRSVVAEPADGCA
ncbi:MAG: GspH/FimT family pseudopilin [Xanthomonadaceae bacterium]|nr:GspH/FimT family pseudopilin [Xanthomonadaceae bacterium]